MTDILTGPRSSFRGSPTSTKTTRMRKSPTSARCLPPTPRMNDRLALLTVKLFATLLYMLVLPCQSISRLVPRSIPHASHRSSKHLHHNHRAEVGAGKDVPRILLRTPQGILQDRMVASAPEKSGSRPYNPRVELVVERSCAQHANRIGRKYCRQDEPGCHPRRYLCLLRL